METPITRQRKRSALIVAELTCDAGVLNLRVEGEKADLPQLEDVVGRHLVRFGAKDELVVHWTHADGSPGTQQPSD